jgi:hypothetical protein
MLADRLRFDKRASSSSRLVIEVDLCKPWYNGKYIILTSAYELVNTEITCPALFAKRRRLNCC